MDQAQRHLPPEFWSSPAVAAALASCDFATLLDEIRKAHGWTQKQLALAVGYSQSWVSNVLRRQQALTVDQVREISRRIGVPVHLLRFGDPGGDDPTKRRDFGKAMALALVPLPTRAVVDETTAPTLRAITGAQRRLDATTSARELARGVAAHVEMANRLLARADKTPYAADVAAAASEAAGFAAWLHADMYDIGSARAYYRMAIGRARQAGQDLLAGYMLGSLAAFEIDGGDPELGLTLVGEARQQIGATPHPAPRAWLDATEALSLRRCAPRRRRRLARAGPRREGHRPGPADRAAALALGVPVRPRQAGRVPGAGRGQAHPPRRRAGRVHRVPVSRAARPQAARRHHARSRDRSPAGRRGPARQRPDRRIVPARLRGPRGRRRLLLRAHRRPGAAVPPRVLRPRHQLRPGLR